MVKQSSAGSLCSHERGNRPPARLRDLGDRRLGGGKSVDVRSARPVQNPGRRPQDSRARLDAGIATAALPRKQSATLHECHVRPPVAVPVSDGATRVHFVRGPKSECLRSSEHTSELQSQSNLVCRLLLEKKTKIIPMIEL